MPHDTGANSDWVDIRDLAPHRRPTCMVEDHQGHLWIGTQWDGIIRMNAHGRKYYERAPENNLKDGTEFSFFTSKEIGVEFDRVTDLAVSEKQGVWAVLSSRKSGGHIAYFDGDNWTTLTTDENVSISCVAETGRGEVLVGAAKTRRDHGMSKVSWQTQKVEPVPGLSDGFRDIVKMKDGRVFAASRWALYESQP